MNPTQGQNPFAAIMAKFQNSGAQAPQGGQMPAGPHMMPNGQMMGGAPTDEEPVPNQLKRGETGDNTQNLVKAVQAVQGYIANSTDPQEIAVARSIIGLMSKLIMLDQQNMSKRLPEDHAMMGSQPPTGLGAQNPA